MTTKQDLSHCDKFVGSKWRMRQPMTEHKKTKLIELYNQGLTNKKIAKELGINRRTVYAWIKKLELPPRQRYKRRTLKKMHTLKYYPQFKKMVAELHKLGFTDRKIAEELEVSPQTVGVIRAKLGLPLNYHKRN
jgi:DNA-binding NarL/FixJ family response regulator